MWINKFLQLDCSFFYLCMLVTVVREINHHETVKDIVWRWKSRDGEFCKRELWFKESKNI